jgi:pyruvate,orthophosphate dikinase
MKIVRIGDGPTKRHSVETVGAKAANLARMAALGVPVPPAFVLPVNLCAAIVRDDSEAKQKLTDGLTEGIAFLENATGKLFGDRHRPLLVSVRSGAARSMPGMLDTVLNVGCTSAAVHGLVRMTGHPRFAWDCRRRFVESYAGVVLGVDPASFAGRLAELVAAEGVESEQALDGEALERLAGYYQQVIEDEDGLLSEDPMEQLKAATQAVYHSWTSDRARTYRQLEHLQDLHGTAVTIQAMVFGNRGLSSGAGVAFSRDPSTGAKEPIIDVLSDAQGEDVVSGRRTPQAEAIAAFPVMANELREVLTRLEREFGDVQDVEFTVEDGKLWILQTRPAKRTPRAALRFAIDFVREGLISPGQALRRLDGVDLDALAYARLVDPGDPVGRGVGASGGVAVGRVAFESESARRLAACGDPVILARPDTSTADIAGFAASVGIVTATGGRTAHAALVARQMGKPCIVGCSSLAIDLAAHRARLVDATIEEGEWITVDGDSGGIYLGRRDIVTERPVSDLREVEGWRAALPTRSRASR